MTPNDSEMDVLLRRYAKIAGGATSTEHLDADELNAFAEGALPAAARSRYVSHLADCDNCRRVVSGLTAASDRVPNVTVAASEPVAVETSWQKIVGLFAPARLRYAAFAAVLVAVAGIGYTVWRQSHETPARPAGLVSSNEQVSTSESARTSQSKDSTSSGVAPAESPEVAKNVTQSTPAPFLDQKQPESKEAAPPPPPKPADVLARNETAPVTATTRAAESSANAAAPSYAPPPPVESERERADTRTREQQNLGYLHGPMRGESAAKNKGLDDRSRAGDFSKARDEDRVVTTADQPVAKTEAKQEESGVRRRSERTAALASRSAEETRQEAPKSDKAGPPPEADTRTVDGRKFKRQGNAWIDLKLKSSMSIRTISRGTEDFDKLDSGLRSIAQQFGGPVVVVWKGKAYRIQ
jgi:hypothetical protein